MKALRQECRGAFWIKGKGLCHAQHFILFHGFLYGHAATSSHSPANRDHGGFGLPMLIVVVTTPPSPTGILWPSKPKAAALRASTISSLCTHSPARYAVAAAFVLYDQSIPGSLAGGRGSPAHAALTGLPTAALPASCPQHGAWASEQCHATCCYPTLGRSRILPLLSTLCFI
jgi:hypothetical protein